MQTFPLLVYSFCYVMAFTFTWISKKEGNHRLINNYGAVTDNPGNIVGFHLTIMLWLGIVPVLFLNQPVLKPLTGNGLPDSSLLIIFLLLFMLTVVLAVKAGATIQQQFASTNSTTNKLPALFIARYFIIRTVFLFVYELFFRGFLLFESIRVMGILLAVTLNVLLHALLHLFSSKKEMLACIPFSLLVCLLCILFNAAWPAIILHITFSIIYEIRIYTSYFSTPKIAQL